MVVGSSRRRSRRSTLTVAGLHISFRSSRNRAGLLLALLLAACSPAPAGQGPGSAPSGGQAAPAASQSGRQITVAIGAEVNNLAPKLESGNTFASEFNFMTDSPLTVE